jgi:hypothetical protein
VKSNFILFFLKEKSLLETHFSHPTNWLVEKYKIKMKLKLNNLGGNDILFFFYQGFKGVRTFAHACRGAYKGLLSTRHPLWQ